MPLTDYTEYYSGVIDIGNYQIDTVEQAEDAVEDLVEQIETEVFFHMQQISLYSAVPDEIEGFVPLRPELLTDESIFEAVGGAFCLKAILLKFPELQDEYRKYFRQAEKYAKQI